MLNYFLRRLLWVAAVLWVISVVCFLLGYYTTDDPVTRLNGSAPVTTRPGTPALAAAYQRQAHLLHLDYPVFYGALQVNGIPDTLYRIYPYQRREKLRKMAVRSGSWAEVSHYEANLQQTLELLRATLPDSLLHQGEAPGLLVSLEQSDQKSEIQPILVTLNAAFGQHANMASAFRLCENALTNIPDRSGIGYPVWHWYGSDNLYHHWITGRYAAGEGSPWKKIWYSLQVSLLLNGAALILSVLLGIPIGIWLARHQSRSGRVANRLTMFLYVMPVMLLACLLRFAFATPGQGWYQSWIGGIGVTLYDPAGMSFWHWVGINFSKLILPVLTLALHFSMLIALQMRVGMLDTLRQDYIRAALGRGLSDRQVYWGHALRTALFPVIAVVGSLLPLVVSGGMMSEAVFNINGLGSALVEAVFTGNHPVMMTIVMLTAFLTVLGSFLADLLFVLLDPRVREGIEGSVK